MALRAKKPEAIEKRLKALFYGGAGVGKTTAAIQFPKPYLIDTERGAENDQYTKLLNKAGGVIFQTSDFDELVREVTALLTEKHEYKTLIIDPLTTLYNDLLDKSAIKHGTDFGRHYSAANKKIEHLINLLYRLDMNVIITAHSKALYGQNMAIIGDTFDCYKKLDFVFDLVLEIQKRGKERIALVKKSRIESFANSEPFQFSYSAIAKYYGKEILERDAVAQELADENQIREIIRLIDLIKVPEETYKKWLDKSGSEKWEEMPKDAIQKCITHLESKIKGEE
jgi:hypothetical protein